MRQLQALKETLQQRGYECIGTDTLEVILKKEASGRVWKALLHPTSQKLVYGTEQENAHFLQIFLSFPYECTAEHIHSVARLLLLLNKGLPFPAFGLSEVEGTIYYRHVLYCKNKALPTTLISSLLGMLLLYIDSLSPMIEQVASGKKGLQEVLKEVLTTDESNTD